MIKRGHVPPFLCYTDYFKEYGMDWKVVEMMGYAYYCERGWRILLPIVDTSGYDFCIEKGGVFKRVNVKRAGLKDKSRSNSWCIAVASGAHNEIVKAQTADIFLAYVAVDEGVFVELPGDFFHGTVSKSRVIPTKLIPRRNALVSTESKYACGQKETVI